MRKTLTLFMAIAGLIAAQAEGPKVAIITGPNAPALEQLAAKELRAQWETLFQARITDPAAADYRVLIGSPATNPAVKAALGDGWPASLSDQGHVLKSVQIEGRPGLVAGGGSPVATLWAVYEVGHSFGMRYLLHGDFPPLESPPFSLSGFDQVLEPSVKVRAWRSIDTLPVGQASWPLSDHQRLLRQLAKLKFNHLTLALHPWQPFVELEAAGTRKQQAMLWKGETLSVTGDTAGRSVFKGASVFENPDFAGRTTYPQQVETGVALIRSLIQTAGDLGMTASLEFDISQLPDEFAALDTAGKQAAAEALAKAYRATYPQADWTDRKLLPLALSQPQGGVLPQMISSQLPAKLESARAKEGFLVKAWIPGDLSPDLYFLSRASFDPDVTPAGALEDLTRTICGEGVAERLAIGFAAVEKATALMEKEAPGFALPHPDMFMRHYQSSEPAPAWWADATALYGEAVNEMYRANTRTRDGARPFVLYHAKRYTFALHYMTAVDLVRKAGLAKAAGDEDGQVENLELAVEAMHNALAIYSEVAQDQSDRGVIAVVNAYGYRPLLKALDHLP